jgi:secreted PhoX family phosphatase
METVCFSETLVSTYESTRHHNPEEHQHLHRRENLKTQSNTVAGKTGYKWKPTVTWKSAIGKTGYKWKPTVTWKSAIGKTAVGEE